MKQLTTTQIWLLSIVFFLALGVMGAIEQKDKQAAADHAQYIKALAQQEDKDRKREAYNRLAFEGERLTGYAGDMK